MEGIETVAEQQAAVEIPVLTPEQVDFNQQMQYAFMDEPPATQVDAPISEEVTDPVLEQVAPVLEVPTVDYNKFVKETFEVDTVEEAKTRWAELQALKDAPQTTKEIEFANEQSKKLHENLKAGNIKEVTAYLKAQELLESVDTMNSEQKLKLYIKMQNPKFDSELIDDEYKSLYTLNEDDFDLLEPLAQRKERLKLEQRLENDVLKAEEHFTTYKQKIQLPEIQPQQATIDADYEAYKASNAQVSENINNVLIPAIQSLKESDIQLGFKVQDPNNKMEFDVPLVVTPEAFKSAKESLLAIDDYIRSVGFDKDGNFNPSRLQRLILINDNFDNYAQTIARQAVNAERIRTIAKEVPDAGSGGRDFNTVVERSEFQKEMDARFV